MIRARSSHPFVLLALLLTPVVARADDSEVTPSAEVDRLLAANTPPNTLAGYPTRYWVERGGRGASRFRYGMLSLSIPSPGLLLQVRRHDQFDEERHRSRLFVDVPIGDATFDAAYLVEGAPSDLVRTLLDEPLRRALLDRDRVVLNVDDRFTQFSIGGGPRTLDEARGFVALATLVAQHLRAGLEPAPGIALTPAARAAELAHLRAIHDARQRANIPFIIMMGLVGTAVIVMLIVNMRRKRRRR